MTEIDFERLTEIDEYKAILALNDNAKVFLDDQSWCRKTIRSWYDFGIFDKIGVFLFLFDPLIVTVVDFICFILFAQIIFKRWIRQVSQPKLNSFI